MTTTLPDVRGPAARRRRPSAAATAATAVLAVLLSTLGLTALARSAHAADTLLSQGKTATASSTEGAGYSATNAVDDNTATRWASTFGADPQWIQVDLGASASITSVTLTWEAAYAKTFRLETSTNATTWTPLTPTSLTSTGGTQTVTTSGTGRYLRMTGTTRALSAYGYSLYELKVYGTTGTTTPTPTPQGAVAVTGTRGAWQLSVGGAPYTVKGITYGPPQAQAATYLPDIRAMGANTVRIWGVDDANTPTLLTAAANNGLKVIVGHWLDHGRDYVNDSAYKTAAKNDVLRRVNALKGYPGVLMWDLGNEVILTTSGASPAEVEARRVAYARFVNDLAVAVHQADPNHPVTSTDASTGAWDYYQRYSPALDLYAVNTYGGAAGVKQAWVDGGYTKPYVFTESGPPGDWEVGDDANGVPNEPTDQAKRDACTSSWNAIASHPGVGLGGTEFNDGLEDDFAGVWFNVNTGGAHRLCHDALRRAWTGSSAANTPPVISAMTVSSPTGVRAGATFTVGVTASDPQGDPITYTVKQGSRYVDGSGTLSAATATQTGPGQFQVTAPTRTGVWKVYVYASDGHGNVGVETRSVRVTP